MKRLAFLAAVACLWGYLPGTGRAGPVKYTDMVTASGTLGSSSFNDALVTLTLSGDTANVTGVSGFFSNTVGAFKVTVAGIGTATFTDSLEVFDNHLNAFAGFEDLTAFADVLDTRDATFVSYDLTTSIGPVTNSSLINPGQHFNTTLGQLIFDSAAADSTFTAVTSSTVPEPAGLTLAGLAVVGLARYRRWRKP
jgi:hypothetical protein